MNITAIRQEARKNKINEIVEALRKTFASDLMVDKEKLICECCAKWSMSKRIVKEYLDIALVSINTEEFKEDGRVMIMQKKELVE